MTRATYKPHPVVILAVDPGKVSGVALYHAGKLIDHGTADIAKIVRRGIASWPDVGWADGEAYGMRLVVAIESHNPHGRWGFNAQQGLAESVGVWKAAVNALPKRRPVTRIVRIPVDAWRKAIFGVCRLKPHPVADATTQWKFMAIQAVQQRHNLTVTDHNEAEAILIGECASKSGEVAKVLGKRERG